MRSVHSHVKGGSFFRIDSLQIDFESIVRQPIEEGVCDRRFAQVVMPAVYEQVEDYGTFAGVAPATLKKPIEVSGW